MKGPTFSQKAREMWRHPDLGRLPAFGPDYRHQQADRDSGGAAGVLQGRQIRDAARGVLRPRRAQDDAVRSLDPAGGSWRVGHSDSLEHIAASGGVSLLVARGFVPGAICLASGAGGTSPTSRKGREKWGTPDLCSFPAFGPDYRLIVQSKGGRKRVADARPTLRKPARGGAPGRT